MQKQFTSFDSLIFGKELLEIAKRKLERHKWINIHKLHFITNMGGTYIYIYIYIYYVYIYIYILRICIYVYYVLRNRIHVSPCHITDFILKWKAKGSRLRN